MSIFSPDWALVWAVWWIVLGLAGAIGMRVSKLKMLDKGTLPTFGYLVVGLLEFLFFILQSIFIAKGIYGVVGVFQ